MQSYRPASNPVGWSPSTFATAGSSPSAGLQEQLPRLLQKLGVIDFFIHDSEHSYECMMFEMTAAAERLRPRGLLIVDDSSWNPAYAEFVRERGLASYDLGGGTAAALQAQ